MARDSAVARILVQPSSVTMAGPAWCNPVTHRAAYPQAIPIAWLHNAFRGLADGVVGVKNIRKAVAPSEGKMNGVWKTIANPQRMPMLIKPLMNMKRAHI